MKKLVSYILSVLIVMSCMFVPTFAADKSGDSKLSNKQFSFLKAMGSALENSVEKVPSGIIQRGVAARRFCFFGNFKYNKVTNYEALFYDISTDHYYYPYVKGCYDAGVMNGYPDGTFRPDEGISTMEAAKVFLYTIGYREYIEIAGLQHVLQQTGLMDGIATVSDNMSYTDFYIMMYNAYHAPACTFVEFTSDGGVNCKVSEDYLGMEYLDNIKCSSGIVDGVMATGLEWPDETMTENMISIGGKRYAYKGDAGEYLGYHVDFYYKTGLNNKTDGNEVVFIQKTDKNRTLVLDHESIEDYSDHKFRYVEKNKYKIVEISENTDIIYNGVACPNYTDDDLIPKYGTVTLIDNDRSIDGYEVALIENIEFFVVDTVDTKKLTITDINEEIAILDMEKADVMNISWDGEAFPMERILRGNMLKVKRTKPECGYYICDIEVFKNAKNNIMVTKATEDSVFESTFEHPVWNNIDSKSRALLKAGKVVTLYMYEDRVVRVTAENGDLSTMAYLMNVASDGVISKEISFRIINGDSTAFVFKAAKRIKLDENFYEKPDEIMSYLANTAQISKMYSTEAPYAQPIKFKTNNDGRIISIDTMRLDEKEDPQESLVLVQSTADDVNAGDSGYEYRAIGSGVVYSNTHVATMTAQPIKVPIEGAQRLDDRKYVSKLDGDKDYQMEIFNLDTPINKTDCAVVYTVTANNTVVYTNNHDPAIIYSKTANLNDDGEIEYVLETYYRKTTKTYKYKEDDVANNEVLRMCDVGDVIQAHEDKFGFIDGIKMVFDVSEFIPRNRRIYTWGAGGAAIPVSKGYKALYTTVAAKDSTHIRTTLSHPEDDEGFDSNYQADTFVPSPATIYKYSVNRGEPMVDTATVSDIVSYEQSKEDFTPVIIIYSQNSGGMNNMYIICQ